MRGRTATGFVTDGVWIPDWHLEKFLVSLGGMGEESRSGDRTSMGHFCLWSTPHLSRRPCNLCLPKSDSEKIHHPNRLNKTSSRIHWFVKYIFSKTDHFGPTSGYQPLTLNLAASLCKNANVSLSPVGSSPNTLCWHYSVTVYLNSSLTNPLHTHHHPPILLTDPLEHSLVPGHLSYSQACPLPWHPHCLECFSLLICLECF